MEVARVSAVFEIRKLVFFEVIRERQDLWAVMLSLEKRVKSTSEEPVYAPLPVLPPEYGVAATGFIVVLVIIVQLYQKGFC